MLATEIIFKSIVTLVFLWTILVIYIIASVDSDVKWARWVVKSYALAWLLTCLISVLGAIWTS